MNPLKRFIKRVGKLVRRALEVGENLLYTLLGREAPNRPRVLEPDEQLPQGADYRKTFLLPSDAEAYASEIPVPTVIVLIYPDDAEDTDDVDPEAYEVYVVYGDSDG